MITNFQYILNPSELRNNAIWQTVNDKCILSDFKIVAKRDETDLLIVRYNVDANIFFYCSDFDNLVQYAISRTPIYCRFTENICNKSKTHYGYLKFDKKIDYKINQISATIILLDEYSRILDGLCLNPNKTYEFYKQPYTISTKIGDYYKSPLNGFIGSDFWTTQKIFNNLTTSPNQGGMTTKTIKLTELFYKTFAALNLSYGRDYFDITYYDFEYVDILGNLFVCNAKDFYTEFSFNKPKQEPPDYIDIDFSIKDILNYLRDNLYIYWYLSNNKIYFKVYRNETFNNYLTITEKIGDKNIEVAEPEFNVLKYEGFSENVTKDPFDTQILKFNNTANSEKTIKSNCIVDLKRIDKTSNFVLLDVLFKTEQFFNYNTFSSQFDFFQTTDVEGLIEGAAIYGDWNELEVKNNTNKKLYFFTKWFPRGAGEKLNISFNLNTVDETTIRMYYQDADSGLTQNHAITQGINTIFDVGSNFELTPRFFRILFEVDEYTNFYNIIRYFAMSNSGSGGNIRAVFPALSPAYGVKIANYRLSAYNQIYNTNKICNMPNDVTSDGLVCHQANIFQQEISYNLNELITDYDFKNLIQTSFGWLRVDKLVRSYDKNKYSECKITLTGN